jgi:hypothetical protein
MARLRLLFALLLMAVGTAFGALAISGYYEPHMSHGQRAPGAAAPAPQASVPVPILERRLRFVAQLEPSPPPPLPPRNVKATKAAPAKAKPAVKDHRPKQAAVQWPWSLFSN